MDVVARARPVLCRKPLDEGLERRVGREVRGRERGQKLAQPGPGIALGEDTFSLAFGSTAYSSLKK